MSVYVCFCRGKSLLSRLITWATGQGPSHAFLVYYDPFWQAAMQVSAEAGGLMVMPANKAGDVSACYEIPSVYHGREALFANINQLGNGYDYTGFLGMTWVMFWWLFFKKKVRNPLNSKADWWCSEFTAKVLKDATVPLTLEVGETEPGRLEDEIVSFHFPKVSWIEVLGARS